jgi:hypothetical protein
MNKYDIIDELFEGMKASPEMSMEMAVVCNPRDGYKVRIDVWENSHGYLDKPRENNQNPAHATILEPGPKRPSSKDVKAKLNITNPEPPKTIAELDERLFDVKPGSLSRKERDSILEWANDAEVFDGKQLPNWTRTWRSGSRFFRWLLNGKIKI